MIEDRRAAVVERVKVISAVVKDLEDDEARHDVLRAQAAAIRDVYLIDIEAYGRLTATVATPDTQH